jgi:hypothetical protein
MARNWRHQSGPERPQSRAAWLERLLVWWRLRKIRKRPRD